MSADPHTPTYAGPEPTAVTPETPVAVPFGDPQALAGHLERPEVALGAAFAGGVLAALILRRLGRD